MKLFQKILRMSDEYKDLVRRGWKAMKIQRHDDRDFVTAIEQLVSENERLQKENNAYWLATKKGKG